MKLFLFTILFYFVYSNVTEIPLLFYGFMIYHSRMLFNYALFTLLFAMIILFKLRYRWEKEANEFAIKIILIIIGTGSIFAFSDSLSTGTSSGFQAMDSSRKETNFLFSLFRFLNLYLFTFFTNCIFLLYCQT